MADNLKPLEDFKTSDDFTEQIDAVLNLGFFRKLAGKTQVILSLAGPAVRTRLTHTVEVARITRTLCDKFGLNSDLGEAIALAHDLGHTPFGHVGERALKEISCGCDTLKGKVNETDFENSGFKHNLQSFRVLSTLETVSDENINKWLYILWGVSAHSNMTWSKKHIFTENDILISCEQCERVYSCFYHEKRECKRNILEKKKEIKNTDTLLCVPSFCAGLDKYKNKNEIPKELAESLGPGFKREDLVGSFVDEATKHIYCTKPCYLSNLSAHKMEIENKEIANMFPYLFDHPFPNSFYAPCFFNYFSGEDKDFISVEALVVSKADEIAQRQQDMEDAVSMELISFETAKDDVEALVKNNKIIKNKYLKKIKKADNQNRLGKIIVDFYSECLYEITFKKFREFSEKKFNTSSINIYCLMNLLFLLDNNEDGRKNWIIMQIKEFHEIENLKLKELKKIGLDISCDEKYLYFLVCDILEDYVRFGNYENCRYILSNIINELECFGYENTIKIDTELTELIRKIDRIIVRFREKFRDDEDYHNNYIPWKNLNKLNLYPFYILNRIMEILKEKRGKGEDCFTIEGLLNNIDKETIENCINSYDINKAFEEWKQKLKTNANTVLGNFVEFANNEKDDKKEFNKFEEFSKKQKNYILKSELVEKSDGKANYILKRLFSAFITDAHQLPDDGLNFILIALSDMRIINKFIEDEKETFIRILIKLKKTTINERLFKEKFNEIEGDCKFDIKLSNEIKALIEKRRHLWDFYCNYFFLIKITYVNGSGVKIRKTL